MQVVLRCLLDALVILKCLLYALEVFKLSCSFMTLLICLGSF